ncbi:hypothetical protein CspeluHIS016_0104000 [Cutaneotrichosporon spelunceum]|uniref:Peptidase M3A/M3B catalytic domain-containing protein n=1 Tax=Cutaneotrichosporon spelunceum TaxID=1672016 RepID=A0AAD3Y9M1_9TREE|nr:hypothetical protein CspeluHIS016_0104000 [Cutaneotrichosporon spelunceum]
MPATYPKPPTRPPHWVYTPKDIGTNVDYYITDTDKLLDEIAALPQGQRTFDNTARRMAFHDSAADKGIEPGLFLQYVSEDEGVRNASVDADKRLQEYGLKTIAREDIYQALLDANEHAKTENKLNSEEQRLIDRMIRDRKRNGLGLEKSKRDELLKIQTKIMGLEVDFQRVCNEEKGFLLFTEEELVGVPKAAIEGYPKEGDKYKVTYKTPDIVPIFQYADNPETRRRAQMGYEGKTIQNVPVLEEIVQLRKQVADILGFENFADYILDIKMAKNSKTVTDFLNDLRTKLTPLGEAEKKNFLELKKEVHEAKGYAPDDELNLWDYRYYDRLWTERKLALDDEKVKEYFPVNKVVPTILDIYKQLLSVQFYPVPRDEEHGGNTWHKDAEAYAVWDHQDGKDGEFLGYMYLDLFPRENKYGHAAVWGLIPGWTKEDGGRSYPTVCMVANLAKPTPTRPALMKHSDVVTFFHEMGHAFHGLCSRTQFSRFHGTHVARDFVEAPSQMLENWCWLPEQLKTMSSHYETGENLPDDLIQSIVKSKNVNQGLFNLRQLFFGLYDMTLHTSKEELDQTKLWCDLRTDVSLVTTKGEYVGGQSGFAHIVGGYAAGYYGYLYSLVFAADMFETVFSKDPMSPENGMKYRNEILKVGGSRDEMDSLVALLGRKPTNDAFLRDLLGGADGEAARL